MQFEIDIFWLLFFHLIGDLVFQNTFMYEHKYDSKFLMFSHCVLWTGGIALGFFFFWDISLNIYQLSFLLIGHYLMDCFRHPFVKENKKAMIFDFDFFFHMTQLIIVYDWAL